MLRCTQGGALRVPSLRGVRMQVRTDRLGARSVLVGSAAPASGTLLPQACMSTRKWKQLGTRKAPNPEEKLWNFGGRPREMTVIRVNQDRTVMVATDQWRRDPKYLINKKSRIKFMAHDPNNICHVGDIVLVTDSRPFSKFKRHEVKKIIKKDPGIIFLAQNPDVYVDPSLVRASRNEEMRLRKIVVQKKKKTKGILTAEEEASVAGAVEAKKKEDQELKEARAKQQAEEREKELKKAKKKTDKAPPAAPAPGTEKEAEEAGAKRGEALKARKKDAAKKQAKLIDQVKGQTQSSEMAEKLAELAKLQAGVKAQYGVDAAKKK